MSRMLSNKIGVKGYISLLVATSSCWFIVIGVLRQSCFSGNLLNYVSVGMDILSDDGSQLVERLISWEEMYERPRYQKDVNPEQVTISRIISDYEMSDEGKCGLSTCHAPHKKGYLVLCKWINGNAIVIETNIGHICGSKIFGHTFEEHRKNYRRDLNTIRYRDLITDQICNIEKNRDLISTLRKSEGGDKAYASIRNLIQKRIFNSQLVTKLERRASSGNSEVIESVEASKEDIDREETRLGKKLDEKERERLTVQHSLGFISGVRAILDYSKIKEELVVELPQLLNDLEEVKPEELSYTELEKWSKTAEWLGHKVC